MPACSRSLVQAGELSQPNVLGNVLGETAKAFRPAFAADPVGLAGPSVRSRRPTILLQWPDISRMDALPGCRCVAGTARRSDFVPRNSGRRRLVVATLSVCPRTMPVSLASVVRAVPTEPENRSV